MAKQKKPILTITITLRGEPGALAHALANGLPLPALEEIRDGMTEELERRHRRPAQRNRPVRIKARARQ